MNLSRIAILTIGASLATNPANALTFPETCISPPATVTSITGIDTRHAHMKASYTLPDIIQACHQGYVDQAGAPPNVCVARHRNLLQAPPLHATADCVAGIVTVEGERTVLPAHRDCASGGFRAIAAFKTLCPSYRGAVEREN
jgi:hypothetical protein